MDKNDWARPLNKKLIPKSLTNNDQHKSATSQSVAAKKNENNIIDYKNISLTLTGQISSSYICRDNLIQKQPDISLVEDTEDNDEQFISNMKEIIDKNYKMQNKENHSIKDLQTKSYLSKKKKCVFSDEDQKLIKRFKKSVDESKVLHATSQMQQSENITSIGNSKCLMITSTPKIDSAVTLSKIDTDFRSNTNLYHINSQKNDQAIMPKRTAIFTENQIETEVFETEFQKLIYYETHYLNLTPPRRNE